MRERERTGVNSEGDGVLVSNDILEVLPGLLEAEPLDGLWKRE